MQKICMVIPCYNEGNRIDTAAFSQFAEMNRNYHFLFINDGSSDNTLERLEGLVQQNKETCRLYHLANNVGKGNAIRKGILDLVHEKEQYDFIGFIDADLSTPITEIPKLLNRFKENESLLMVSGIRLKKLGSTVVRSAMRHYIGRIFATIVSILYKLDNYDTQCGAKLFRFDIGVQIFSALFISRWLFDIEIFLRIRKITGPELYNKAIEEFPLSVWVEKRDSRIRLLDLLLIPGQLIKIYLNYGTSKS